MEKPGTAPRTEADTLILLRVRSLGQDTFEARPFNSTLSSELKHHAIEAGAPESYIPVLHRISRHIRKQ